MKIIQINATCGIGSTGKICKSVSELLTQNGIENYIFYTQGKSNYNLGVKYTNGLELFIYKCIDKVFGMYGFSSCRATKKLIKQIERIQPDIIHLHNIHAHNINLELFFKYIKEKQVKCYWTFHDCWAFTGYCTHFSMVKCEKWKNQCYRCPVRKKYSCLFDKSKKLYAKKKELLSGLDMEIITPSKWLAGIVKESFLGNYPVKVINNGIDLNIFYPRPNAIREQFKIEKNIKIILGVAYGWDERKGLDVFIELASRFEKNKYKIVLVGTNDYVDSLLPENIISIHRTNNQKELAEIYSVADVFVNPTREENYPTVNMEAVSCGTPVITFDTGGSSEMLDSTVGRIVECDDINSLEAEIRNVCDNEIFSSKAFCRKAIEFEAHKCFEKYVNLYEHAGK